MKIKVMVYHPGKAGELQEIEDSLGAMQDVVGGYIEQVFLPGLTTPGIDRPRLVVICNEEGRLKRAKPNRWGLVGPFFIVRQSGPGYASLTEEDVAFLREVS